MLPSKIFCLSVPKSFAEEPLCDELQKTSFSAKFINKRGEGNQDILSKMLCLTVLKKFEGEPFCDVFQKISGSEKVYGKEGGVVSRFSVEIVLSHSAEKLSRGTLL